MCGIFGHIGGINSIGKCLQGLHRLEYRGYDSTGVAGIESGQILCRKEVGNVSHLANLLGDWGASFEATIGHTRWATHGKPSRSNAHPHLDEHSSLALVHNGIIENYLSLRLMLEQEGRVFQTDTDTEVVAQLIASLYEGDIVRAVHEATQMMKGVWALAILHREHPDKIIATSRETPLLVALCKKKTEGFISSDPHALPHSHLDSFFLKMGEIALLSKGNITLYDHKLCQINRPCDPVYFMGEFQSKGNFDHFMLKEIFDQPTSLKRAIEEGPCQIGKLPPFPHIKRVVLLGCGTSWHAAQLGAMQFEKLAHIPAQAEIASEFRYRETVVDSTTLIVALSQSGETFDLIGAVRKVKERGAPVIALCNVSGSTLTREADFFIPLYAGQEVSVCSTKGFTCAVVVLTLLARALGNKGEEDAPIKHLPELVEKVLDQRNLIKKIALEVKESQAIFFIGRQEMFPASLEAALKLKEISYIQANAYPAGELKHGPMALIDPQSVVIALCGNSLTIDKMVSNLMEIQARGAPIYLFASDRERSFFAHLNLPTIWIPWIEDGLSAILYVVANQLLAYYVAQIKKLNIDQPRNLAKSVTVE